MFGLLITNAAVADSYTEKLMLKHSAQLLAGQWNPWVLPEVPEKTMGFQCPAEWQSEQSQDGTAGTQGQGRAPEFKKRLSGRFVTPDILESLKQQQIQTQMTPSNESYRQLRPQQPVTRLPEKSYYGNPAYGMGSANPLYDVPTVSPWGSGSDVIYRGGIHFPERYPIRRRGYQMKPSVDFHRYMFHHLKEVQVGESLIILVQIMLKQIILKGE